MDYYTIRQFIPLNVIQKTVGNPKYTKLDPGLHRGDGLETSKTSEIENIL
jgi:hypothetical protein